MSIYDYILNWMTLVWFLSENISIKIHSYSLPDPITHGWKLNASVENFINEKADTLTTSWLRHGSELTMHTYSTILSNVKFNYMITFWIEWIKFKIYVKNLNINIHSYTIPDPTHGWNLNGEFWLINEENRHTDCNTTSCQWTHLRVCLS